MSDAAVRTGDRTAQRTPPLLALALVVGAGPFSTDTYIAALPALRTSLSTTASAAQLSITVCIVGLAVGMLFAGPISDVRGRRPLLLLGALTYAVAGLACAVAPSIGALLVLRLFQGAAAGACAAVGRAVVADRYTGVERAQKYGMLGAITLIGPVIAPAIGGVILSFSSWRGVFVFMGVLGVAMLASAWFGVPESLRPRTDDPVSGFRRLWIGMARVIRRPAFLRPLVVNSLATAGFFVYIGGSAFVLETTLGVSESLYSVVFATNALAMVLMSWLFARLVGRFGPRRLIVVGVGLSTLSVVLLVVVTHVLPGPLTLGMVWPFLTAIVGGQGMTGAAGSVMAQEAGSDYSGAASSLLSGITFLVGSATTPLTGVLGGGVPTMALAMAVFFVVDIVVLAATSRRRPVPREAAEAT
ncbi:multidrug effflux MFS transporter [Frondihabitans australicus]|uniref:DHA1 family bicyclomycin/chloramphenicol resistance-like MFS transporter n=1 Tax=Frondihabitans australicus TaxID=386892 RepID=A0A495IHJ1_9MICO|nr:multidrug effflux MFS transporter [Frondihabitans australicus]RKR75229.1 DHA1 family bicyclomycin/chloramphenicol resistance-like MFS transporter [Frondihabitans australicus]